MYSNCAPVWARRTSKHTHTHTELRQPPTVGHISLLSFSRSDCGERASRPHTNTSRTRAPNDWCETLLCDYMQARGAQKSGDQRKLAPPSKPQRPNARPTDTTGAKFMMCSRGAPTRPLVLSLKVSLAREFRPKKEEAEVALLLASFLFGPQQIDGADWTDWRPTISPPAARNSPKLNRPARVCGGRALASCVGAKQRPAERERERERKEEGALRERERRLNGL